ncbi:MAG: hypothetical protein AVDCRST_MAG68-5665 [uncultured Gemmatimonadetes bacterium]|uniref:Uncharacterized protein n=1 Tax=uncultured Gemmatimonadota bacterium TaxID=203437 RepID=A0A6J4N099_9BACT|nr:MAG: hypothetical protein AVDCRST_MAG68-5665 [uncultured Gemmatimonadota bacterium]
MLGGLLLVGACASPGGGAGESAPAAGPRVPGDRWLAETPDARAETAVSEVIPVAADEVYALLDEAYASLGIEVASASAGERKMGNTYFTATRRLGPRLVSEYVRCADNPLGGSMADTKPVRFSVLSTVTPLAESSRLSTRVQASTATGERGGALLCTSTGLLEAGIAREVKLRLVQR